MNEGFNGIDKDRGFIDWEDGWISGDTFGVDRTGGIPPYGGNYGITKEKQI